MNISSLMKSIFSLAVLLLVWTASAVAGEESDVERGRRLVMESLYDVVYLGNSDERMVRWKTLPKVMVVNASAEERVLTQDKVRQYSETFGSMISFTDEPSDAGVIVFFVSSYDDVATHFSGIIRKHFGDSDFSKASPKLFSNLAVHKFPFLVETYSTGGVEGATALIFIRSGSDRKGILLVHAFAISFGMRGVTENYSVANIGAAEDLTNIDKALLKFMYFHGRPGMGWPEANVRMERLMDQIFGGGR